MNNINSILYDQSLFLQRHLNPCPFCDGTSLTTKTIHTNTYGPCTLIFVKCKDCGAQGPIYKYKGDSEKCASQQLVQTVRALDGWGTTYDRIEVRNFIKTLGQYDYYELTKDYRRINDTI